MGRARAMDEDANERWRVLALMTGSQAGSSLVQQALGSLSPILVATFALSKAQLGVVVGAVLVGATCCTAISGALTDRWGERTMLLVSGTVMGIALFGATAFATYPWLTAMMALYGAGYAASTPAGGRAILSWFDRDRGFAMGIRQTGVSVGGLLGALAMPALAVAFGYRSAFVFAAVLMIATSGFAYVLYREHHASVAARRTFATVARGMAVLARDPRLIAITLTCMLLSSSQFIMNAFLTITATTVVHTSVHLAGFALALAFVAAIVARLGWGIVSDRYFRGDRLVPLAIICVVAAAGCGLLVVVRAGAIDLLLVASVLLGLSASGWNGLMATALSEVGGAESAASALGVGLTGMFAASAVAPWLFGLVAGHTSLALAWAGVGVMVLAAVVPVVWLRMRAPAVDGVGPLGAR